MNSPQTDDTREAPSIVIINELIDKEATIKAYDLMALLEGCPSG
ncbi:UDP binding domain-containing protein [Desulforamulus reducens]|nr:UDP binding domain-containing protein [Desulforamulus reducens]